MTTEIKDTAGTEDVHVLRTYTDGDVGFRVQDDRQHFWAYMDRADFLAAVEAELGVRLVPADAIVIDRADLAPVRVEGDRAVADGASDPYSACLNANPNWAWQYALNAIAVSEYLNAHPPTPPVDEAQVETLREVLSAADSEGLFEYDVRDFARRLIATGKVSVQP